MGPSDGSSLWDVGNISFCLAFFFSSADFRRRLLGGDHCWSSTQALLLISVLLASVKTALCQRLFEFVSCLITNSDVTILWPIVIMCLPKLYPASRHVKRCMVVSFRLHT